MDDGGDFIGSQKQKIDHERRQGGPYAPKPPISEEQRRLRSERSKDFNRKTGKGTLLGNMLSRRARKPK